MKRNAWLSLFVVVALALVGCQGKVEKEGKEEPGKQPAVEKPAELTQGGEPTAATPTAAVTLAEEPAQNQPAVQTDDDGTAVKEALLGAASMAPEGTVALAAMDVGAALTTALDQVALMLGTAGKDGETRKEIGRYVASQLGFNPFDVKLVVAMAAMDGGAILAPGIALKPSFSIRKTEEHQAKTLSHLGEGVWFVNTDSGLLVGKKEFIKGILDVQTGTAKSLAQTGGDAIHKELAEALGGHVFMATMDASVFGPIPEMGDKVTLQGFAAGSGLTDGFSCIVKADEASRKALMAKLEQGKAMIRLLVSSMKTKMGDLDLFQGIGILYADRHLDDFFALYSPKLVGEYLTFQMQQAGQAQMAMVGVLAAVAIPAFIKYMRKAKTTEAIDSLDRIYKGAVMYYETPRVSEEGELLPPQFPDSAEMTPPLGRCCEAYGPFDENGDGRCDVKPTLWNTPAWSALMFQMTSEHYYSYEFISNGKTGAEAEFTARALGDLDCDGVYGTFERYGKGAADSTKQNPRVQNVGAIYSNNETE